MAIERTLSIIKPDAVQMGVVDQINEYFKNANLSVVASKQMHLTEKQARDFYIVHSARPFYNDLVAYMISGPVVVQILEGEGAVVKNREIMGATNPAEALPGTIRYKFGKSIEANAVHGSDSEENAKVEIGFFFPA